MSELVDKIQNNITTTKSDFKKKSLKSSQLMDIENPVRFLCKKTQYFKVEDKNEFIKKKFSMENMFNKGIWTEEEHDKFLEGIIMFGKNWKKVKTFIKTRSLIQVRSHAQKFYLKMKMCKDEIFGINFTLDSVKSITDMINQIKSLNYDIKIIFKCLNAQYNMIANSKKNKYNVKFNNNNDKRTKKEEINFI